MLKPIERGAALIAAQELRFNARDYRPGDKFDYARLGIQHRRTVETLMKTRKITELTAESMATALRFRDEKAGPPRGFTLAGLKGLGILTEEQIAERGWAQRDPDQEITDENAVWQAPEGAWKVYAEGVTEETARPETTLVIVPFRNGTRGAFRYFVHNTDGERLSGDASIGGKDNAEAWAVDWLKQKAEADSAARNGDPDWSAFPADADDWTDAQVEEFDAWYDGQQPGTEIKVEHEAVARLVEERREAERKEAELQQAGDEKSPIEGLNRDEAQQLLEAMTDEELLKHTAHVTGKTEAELKDLAPLALRELAMQAGGPRDGDIRPELVQPA